MGLLDFELRSCLWLYDERTSYFCIHPIDAAGSSENLTELELEDEDSDEYAIKQRSETEKLLQCHLKESLASCSRQKLRSIQMSLKKQSTVDSRMSEKDLLAVLQVKTLVFDWLMTQ